MEQNRAIETSLERLNGCRFNTAFQPEKHREEWLREVIGREYANVDITPPKDTALYNDMMIYPLQKGIRFSPIQSNPIRLERLPKEPTDIVHDCYFAVLLLSGNYKLEQGGREIFLKPGEMSFYDATEPHKIVTPESFSKLLISIPKHLLDSELNNTHQLTATKLANKALPLENVTRKLHHFEPEQFQALSQPILEMMQQSLIQSGATARDISSFKALSLLRVKRYIHLNLDNDDLDAHHIAEAVRLSIRYINELFQSENTSLMRHVTEKRLERSKQYLSSPYYHHVPITEIALKCGFKNFSHFSRVFKESYAVSPRQCRQQARTMT